MQRRKNQAYVGAKRPEKSALVLQFSPSKRMGIISGGASAIKEPWSFRGQKILKPGHPESGA